MTERTMMKQSLLDDDAISLTSTVSENYEPDDEFKVDRILAEKVQGGRKIYLISWEGYPMEKSTWEPQKNIQDDEILDIWRERKLRESKGLDEPFDLRGFNALLARLAADKAQRHRRRKAKKRRLGMLVSPSESENEQAEDSDGDGDSDSDSSIEDIEENELDDDPGIKTKTKRKSKSPPKKQTKVSKPLTARRGSNTSDPDATQKSQEKRALRVSRRIPREKAQPTSRQDSVNSRHSRTLSPSSCDAPLSRKRALGQTSASNTRPASSSSEDPLALKHSKPSVAPKAVSMVQKLSYPKKSVSQIEPSPITRVLPSTRGGSAAGRGKVATRGGANVAHKNVFQSREPAKTRGNLLKNAMNSGKTPKKFSNMRLLRKAELQARDIAEAAPDISALPGGLFDPSKPESFVPIRPETLRKSSSNMLHLEEIESAGQLAELGTSRENTPGADDPWSIDTAPQALPTERIFPDIQRATCFYWDRAQRDNRQPPCSRGMSCKFQHSYEEGMPVAPRPPHLRFSDETRELSSSNQGSSDLPPWRNNSLSEETAQEVAFPLQWPRGSADISQAGLAEKVAQTPPTSAEHSLDLAAVLERLRTSTDLNSGSPKGPAAASPVQSITTPAPKVKARPIWNPRDPLNSICYFWATSGKCSWGVSCKYLHSNDPELAVAPSPAEQKVLRKTLRDAPERYESEGDGPGRSTCRYWLKNDCKYTNETCRFWHGPESAKVQAGSPTRDQTREQVAYPTIQPLSTGPRVKSVSFAIDEAIPFVEEPESMSSSSQVLERHRPIDLPLIDNYKAKKGICFHWGQGDCHHGAKCWFRHEYAPGEWPNQGSRDVEMQDREKIVQKAAIPTTKSLTPEHLTNARSVAISESLPAATNEADIATHPKGKRPNEENSSELPAPTSDNPLTDPNVKRTKINMDDYRRKKALRELGSRAKEVTFGLDETQSLLLDFGDMKRALESAWGVSFSGVDQVRFDQMCMAQDLQIQQGFLLRLGLWHGNLLPADIGDVEAVRSIDKAADELVLRSAGLLSTFSDFLILAFPAKKEEWKFLESTFEWPQDARLRYFIFQCNLDIRRSLEMKPTSLAIGTPYRHMLVDKFHGLDFKRLLPILKKPQKTPVFYLLFPSTANQTADFIISWLRASNHNCKIYSSQSEGSWHYFTQIHGIDTGTVLVHESAATELDRLPNLYSMAAERNFVFWYISESSSPYPIFPSAYALDDSTMGQLTAIRLFPHGCAFLLTPSFLVAEPHEAVRVLDWFLTGPKPKYLNSTPRTWKLVCCHKFADYVLELANSKAAEKEDFELKHRDNPAKDAMMEDKGLSFNQCKTRYKLHRMLVEFESKRGLESASEGFDSDFDDTEYPFIHADKHIDPDDETALVHWFAAWTMRNLDMYKKFVVVGSSELQLSRRARRMKEVVFKKESVAESRKGSTSFPIPNFKKFSITNKSSESPLESPRSPMTLPKQKALAVAAKLSASSPGRNGINLTDLERNSFDKVAMGSAASPQQETSRNPTISKASPLCTNETTGNASTHGINQQLHPKTLSFSAITGTNARDAERFPEKAKNDVPAAVDLFHNETVENQIMELIATESQQPPPFLATAHADSFRPNELYESPSTMAPISLPDSTHRPKSDARSPPQLDGEANHDMHLPMEFDGTDDRPASSGTDNSKTSRSGIQTDDTGRHVVPRAMHRNLSIRKEIQVQPDYVLSEDGEAYHVPSHRGSAACSANQSTVASSIVEDRMDIDSEDGGSGNERAWTKSRSQEREMANGDTQTVLKEIRFEPTTAWYRRLREKGGGWEHILVASWEVATSILMEQKKS